MWWRVAHVTHVAHVALSWRKRCVVEGGSHGSWLCIGERDVRGGGWLT